MNNFLLMDQPIYTKENCFDPFALTDILIEYAGEKKQPILHFWECENFFILGMKDTRVPDFSEGIQTIVKNGYTPVIRNSGGLGVICDRGVLNLSLIFPKEALETIDHSYEKMYHLIQRVFPELTIDAFEIENSYCPGRFDLSVNAKKIAGLSQRRVKGGIAVMMYLSVDGNQNKRGNIVYDFYRASLKDEFGTKGYPSVDSQSMTTVSDLLGEHLSIDTVKDRVKDILGLKTASIDTYQWIQTNNQEENFKKRHHSMGERNQKLKEDLYANFL
ncbi:MAG TPA: lipoate--protein ligase family protein [Candidatus Tetragenococcus pullicola]|nr:lipoate--protein ligase family protein [Candidatus Tetragenococcus pullicola]